MRAVTRRRVLIKLLSVYEAVKENGSFNEFRLESMKIRKKHYKGKS